MLQMYFNEKLSRCKRIMHHQRQQGESAASRNCAFLKIFLEESLAVIGNDSIL